MDDRQPGHVHFLHMLTQPPQKLAQRCQPPLEAALSWEIARFNGLLIPTFLNNHDQAWFCLGAIGHQDVKRRTQSDIKTTGMTPIVKVMP